MSDVIATFATLADESSMLMRVIMTAKAMIHYFQNFCLLFVATVGCQL
jgi:hypothetical protein